MQTLRRSAPILASGVVDCSPPVRCASLDPGFEIEGDPGLSWVKMPLVVVRFFASALRAVGGASLLGSSAHRVPGANSAHPARLRGPRHPLLPRLLRPLRPHRLPSLDLPVPCSGHWGERSKPLTGDHSWLLRGLLPMLWHIERQRSAGVPWGRLGEARQIPACLAWTMSRVGAV